MLIPSFIPPPKKSMLCGKTGLSYFPLNDSQHTSLYLKLWEVLQKENLLSFVSSGDFWLYLTTEPISSG